MKHKLEVPCASLFVVGVIENCAQTRKLFNTPFNMRGNHFLVHGAEKGFTSILCIFYLFKYGIIIF